MSHPSRGRGRPGLASLLVLAAASGPTIAQALTADVAADAVRIRAPEARFLDGDTLTHLRDGRAMGVQVRVALLAAPGGGVLAERLGRCNVSYDLWEERFAVSWADAPERSVSHLSAREAEAVCLDHFSVPLGQGSLGPGARFRLRLTYRVETPPAPETGAGFTLRSLIDLLSQTRPEAPLEATLEAGPFVVPAGR